MTISSTLNRVSYTGNGSSTAFAVSFPFHAQADLVVLEVVIATGAQTTKALTTDYTISGSTDALGHYSNGGTVNAVTAPASTVRWVIYRDPTRTQPLDLQDASRFPAENIEAQLDYATMLIQRVADLIGRTTRQPDGDASNIGTLPSSVDRASMFLAFDASGDPIAAAGTSGDLDPVSAFIATLLDDANAAAARTTLGAAGSGLTTASGLTIPTARLAGRTTASTGALEDISIGNGLTMAAGSLAADSASETVDGIVELATQAEVNAMTDTARVVTPNHNKIIEGGSIATTSGTTRDITGVPSGVRRITGHLIGVSLSGTNDLLLQLRDAGGLENSGYNGVQWQGTTGVSVANLSTAFILMSSPGAAGALYGQFTLDLADSATNTWTISSSFGTSGAVSYCQGSKALSATLDGFSLLVSGANTFDAGTFYYTWER